jgi:hypothetical protein
MCHGQTSRWQLFKSHFILGGSVNDLKTTFRDGIAVERAIVRVEVPTGAIA